MRFVTGGFRVVLGLVSYDRSEREGDASMPGPIDMPATLERSAKYAQEIWAAAHESALKEYGSGESAHRVAFAAVKEQYKKVGDHWEKK